MAGGESMKGREHIIIGTTATATMGVGILSNNIEEIYCLVPLVIGGIIGSCIPDIDSHSSKARQVFNAFTIVLVGFIFLIFKAKNSFSIDDIVNFVVYFVNNHKNICLFLLLIVVSRLSPHRMFTHKWLGTGLFCYSAHMLGNRFFALGFTTGYILHIVCDRFSPRGKKLNFFELKLPCQNSKNKLSVDI